MWRRLHVLRGFACGGLKIIRGELRPYTQNYTCTQPNIGLALVDALLVIAPLALLCWALPQTYGWARLWFSTFFGAVFVQSIQAVVLRLGAELIGRLPSMLPALANDPIGQSQVWLMTLMLGIAVLQLTRRVPRLIPGLPMGGFSRLPWFRNGGGGRSGSAGRGSGSGRS